jgi:hypothetical protein
MQYASAAGHSRRRRNQSDGSFAGSILCTAARMGEHVAGAREGRGMRGDWRVCRARYQCCCIAGGTSLRW